MLLVVFLALYHFTIKLYILAGFTVPATTRSLWRWQISQLANDASHSSWSTPLPASPPPWEIPRLLQSNCIILLQIPLLP